MATLLDIVKKNATSRSVTIRIIDSTAGTPETGVVFNSAGIDLWYRREDEAVASITEADLTTPALTDTWETGGFLHIGDGEYRLDVPDAAFATGANHVDIGGTVTGMVVIGGRVRLVDLDPETVMRGTDSANTTKTGFSVTQTGLDAVLKSTTFALAMADAIWDEELTGATHNIATSAGRRLRQLEATVVLHEGTADAGAAGYLDLETGVASALDDFYDHCLLVLTGGTGLGQSRSIASYEGITNQRATVTPNWTTTPDGTTTYSVYAAGEVHVREVHTGAIDSGSFAAGAVDAAAIATDAVDADALAADAVAEIQSGLSTHSALNVWEAYDGRNIGADVQEIEGSGAASAALADFAVTGYSTSTHKVQGVVLVDTTTSNSDMVGTNAAALASVWTAARGTILGRLGDTIEDDGGTYRFTENALEEAPSGGASAADIADAVWDETQTDHVGAGTFGYYLDAAISGVGGQAGPGGVPFTLTVDDDESNPIDGVECWVTTDEAGTNTIASGTSNASGQVTFMLEEQAYYFWKQKSGWDFTNPEEITVG